MRNPVKILMIKDDHGHAKLIEKNIRRSNISNDAIRLDTGEAALDDLYSVTAPLRSAPEDALLRCRLHRENEEGHQMVRLVRDRAEALLCEVNHRAGNLLQLVSSFISLQQRHLMDEGARTALREAQGRIEAVAHAHRRLYTSGEVERV